MSITGSPTSVLVEGRGPRSPMTVRWISLVAAHDRVGARRQQRAHQRPSSTAAASSSGREQGRPRTRAPRRRVSARRFGSSPAQKSFTTLDSAPISSPRAMRPSVRALCSRKISTSIHGNCAEAIARTTAKCRGRRHLRRCAAGRAQAVLIAISWSTCSFQMNDAPRSFASVVFATRQPSCSPGPMRVLPPVPRRRRRTPR